eukprot:1530874-Pyramimonas_sp.AAC.1
MARTGQPWHALWCFRTGSSATAQLCQRLPRLLHAEVRGVRHMHEGPLELGPLRLQCGARAEEVVIVQHLADTPPRGVEGARPKGQHLHPN